MNLGALKYWWALIATLGALFSAHAATNDPVFPDSTLPRRLFRAGDEMLSAFAPISQATRHSIVRFNVNGEPMALGVVMDTNGLALTKASEMKKGKLTCWLATDTEHPAELIATDEETDLALVRVHADGLKPIQWASDSVSIGQWAITPGIIETPHAVGIVSTVSHRIRPERAFVGISFDMETTMPMINRILPGMGAEKAGLHAGDIITAINKTDVTNREQVIDLVREFREGQTINLGIQRDDESFDVDVKLMKPPESMVASLNPDYFVDRRVYRRLSGRVSQRAEGFSQVIEHDTVLQPFLCGGPLVNLDGKAIGLNIARASRVSTYALPANLVQQIFQKLKAEQIQ